MSDAGTSQTYTSSARHGTIRLVVKQGGAGERLTYVPGVPGRVPRLDEYLTYDRLRFVISWARDEDPNAPCPPSANYPVLAHRVPSYVTDFTKRLLLYRFPDGREFLGHADARVDS